MNFLVFIIIFSNFFVGDYFLFGIPVLLICFPTLIGVCFYKRNIYLISQDLLFLSFIILFLVVYYLLTLGLVSVYPVHLFHLYLPLFYFIGLITMQLQPSKLVEFISFVLLVYLCITTVLRIDATPFGPNIEYRIAAFLFLVCASGSNKYFSLKFLSYCLLSVFGYSRGGILSFLWLSSVRFKFIAILMSVFFAVVITYVLLGNKIIAISILGLRSLYLNVDNDSEATRLTLYSEAFNAILNSDLSSLLFGQPEYIYKTFYTHNVFIDITLFYGSIVSLFVIVGIMKFIYHTWSTLFTNNLSYFTAFVFAMLPGSLVSGSLYENWPIIAASLLAWSNRFSKQQKKYC